MASPSSSYRNPTFDNEEDTKRNPPKKIRKKRETVGTYLSSNRENTSRPQQGTRTDTGRRVCGHKGAEQSPFSEFRASFTAARREGCREPPRHRVEGELAVIPDAEGRADDASVSKQGDKDESVSGRDSGVDSRTKASDEKTDILKRSGEDNLLRKRNGSLSVSELTDEKLTSKEQKLLKSALQSIRKDIAKEHGIKNSSSIVSLHGLDEMVQYLPSTREHLQALQLRDFKSQYKVRDSASPLNLGDRRRLFESAKSAR